MKDVIIIGGGLAGLVNAIQLAQAGLDVLLIERKHYPLHKVCGEYISNEVVPFLKSIDAYPEEHQPAAIRRFMFTTCAGQRAEMPLDLGGFGISRYTLDHFLYQKALHAGASFRLNTTVQDVSFAENTFSVQISPAEQLYARLVIGAYGKRSRLDKQLQRRFTQQKSPYIGVKYHLRADFPDDCIALHNFESGYCGISRVENDTYNLCYLGSRDTLRRYGSIPAMEEAVLHQNPYLKALFTQSVFLFDKPEVINEVSFASKEPVEQHVLMSGDTAGLITPLCGNGMAMAIHSAKILSALIIRHHRQARFRRDLLEQAYRQQWRSAFATRLWIGRHTQKLFGSTFASALGVQLLRKIPLAGRRLMRLTHGQPF